MNSSKILKDAQALKTPVTMYDLQDMIKEEGRQSVDQEAEKIVKQAKMRREAIEMEAYEKGMEQGQSEGQKVMVKRLQPLFTTFKDAIEQLTRQRELLTEQHIDQLLNLVCLIAEKVVHREIHLAPDIVLKTVKSASTHLMKTDEIRLRLHPSDYEYIKEIEKILGTYIQTKDRLSIVEDNTIDRGGVVIETAFGEIDATIRSQIEHIKEIILEKR